jgi:hypothetical protein
VRTLKDSPAWKWHTNIIGEIMPSGGDYENFWGTFTYTSNTSNGTSNSYPVYAANNLMANYDSFVKPLPKTPEERWFEMIGTLLHWKVDHSPPGYPYCIQSRDNQLIQFGISNFNCLYCYPKKEMIVGPDYEMESIL